VRKLLLTSSFPSGSGQREGTYVFRTRLVSALKLAGRSDELARLAEPLGRKRSSMRVQPPSIDKAVNSVHKRWLGVACLLLTPVAITACASHPSASSTSPTGPSAGAAVGQTWSLETPTNHSFSLSNIQGRMAGGGDFGIGVDVFARITNTSNFEETGGDFGSFDEIINRTNYTFYGEGANPGGGCPPSPLVSGYVDCGSWGLLDFYTDLQRTQPIIPTVLKPGESAFIDMTWSPTAGEKTYSPQDVGLTYRSKIVVKSLPQTPGESTASTNPVVTPTFNGSGDTSP
jgi:hypothetical protein